MRKTLTIALTAVMAVIMLSCGNNIMEDPPREKSAWKDDNTYLAVIKGEGETKQDAKMSVVSEGDKLAAKFMIRELILGTPDKPKNYADVLYPYFKEGLNGYVINAQPQEDVVYKEEGGKQAAYVPFIVEGENLKSEVKARALKALEMYKADAEKKAEKSEETSAKPAEETVKEPVDETDKTTSEQSDYKYIKASGEEFSKWLSDDKFLVVVDGSGVDATTARATATVNAQVAVIAELYGTTIKEFSITNESEVFEVYTKSAAGTLSGGKTVETMMIDDNEGPVKCIVAYVIEGEGLKQKAMADIKKAIDVIDAKEAEEAADAAAELEVPSTNASPAPSSNAAPSTNA